MIGYANKNLFRTSRVVNSCRNFVSSRQIYNTLAAHLLTIIDTTAGRFVRSSRVRARSVGRSVGRSEGQLAKELLRSYWSIGCIFAIYSRRRPRSTRQPPRGELKHPICGVLNDPVRTILQGCSSREGYVEASTIVSSIMTLLAGEATQSKQPNLTDG